MIRTLAELDVKGHRVLTRVDFNVPLTPEKTVRDDTRIRAALPTIEHIRAHGGIPILMSHLGRPKSAPSSAFSLAPIAKHLESLINTRVHFASDCIGDAATKVVTSAQQGDVVLLENLRFYPGEEANDAEFAAQLAQLGTAYVNDAFATVHRPHASINALPQHFAGRRAAGFLMAREIEYLSKVFDNPPRPFVAIIGGAKISDKIRVLERLLEQADFVMLGGGIANTFLAAQGHAIGDSIVDERYISHAQSLFRRYADRLYLPSDIVVSEEMEEHALTTVVSATTIPEESEWRILDIGPETCITYSDIIAQGALVLWNGPMGAFEYRPFRKGTFAIAEAVARATDHGATTIVGGGDSIAAITMAGVQDRISHISTGGGATLEFLEGKPLPGIVALEEQ